MIVGAILLAWLLGVALAATLWPRDRTLRADVSLILPLGAMVGLFATSVGFFVATLLSERPAWWAAALECVVAVGLLWRAGSRWRRESVAVGPEWTWLEWLLAIVLTQTTIVAAVVAWRSFQAEPLGGWDGWAIWNMHARFMLRAGTEWPELLHASQLNWTHPDYPRLIPASVARIWAWCGREDPLASALVSMVFAGATAALLVALLGKVRNLRVGLVGGIVLLATPFFLTFAANEHADIPLGGFMLAAAGSAILAGGTSTGGAGAWVLAGICVGGAAWTKNEGLLFAVIFGSSAALHVWRTRAIGAGRAFLIALAIALIPVAYFKLQLAPANDLVAGSTGSRLDRLGDLSRHATILAALWRDLGRFGEWTFAPWMVLVLPFLAWRARRRFVPVEWIVPCVVGLMLAGYYSVYLVSAQDLEWHLDSSLVRLLLQLWPLAIFAWGLVVPDFLGREANSPARGRWISSRGIFVAVNCAVALPILAAFSLQRGTNELAVKRVGLAEVSVALGAGWFPLEKHAGDEWSWSGGQAKLLAAVGGGKERKVALRFEIGSVGSRVVVVRNGARELWRGEIRDQRVPVAITGLTLSPGTTAIEFSTDTAGVNEPPAAGGRTLAFAIHNLRLE
jgi:hypothetical protein